MNAEPSLDSTCVRMYAARIYDETNRAYGGPLQMREDTRRADQTLYIREVAIVTPA